MIRSSSLPRVFKCPASLKQPLIQVEQTSPESQLGTAIHFYISETIGQKETNHDKIIDEYKLDNVKEYYRFVAAFHKVWDFFYPRIKTIIGVELEIKFDVQIAIDKRKWIIGHLDFAFISNSGELCVIDWKLGYIESDHTQQLMSYVVGLWGDYPDIDRGIMYTVYLNNWDMQVNTISTQDIIEWLNKLKEILSPQLVEKYTPGDHCQYCPLRHECPGKEKMVISTIKELSSINTDLITDDKMAEIQSKIPLLDKLLKQAKSLVKDRAKQGPIPINDTEEYFLDETESENIVMDEKTLDYLAKNLNAPVVDYTKINKTNLKTAVFAQSERGKKGERFKKIIEDLDKMGLISLTIKQQVKKRRIENGK